MLASESKVVKLDNLKVYDQIERYLNQHGYNSLKTKEAYTSDIALFFRVMRNKEVHFLSEEDVQIELDDIEDFVKKLHGLKDKKGDRVYSNKTINRKVSVIKNLMKYLAAKKLVQDVSFVHLIKSLPNDGESYDAFSYEEALQLIDLCLEERDKPLIKYAWFKFSLHSGMRKAEILNLKWSDFTMNGETVIVKGKGKGNKPFKKFIMRELYDELTAIRDLDKLNVFDIGKDAVDKTFQRLRDKMNFPPEDNRYLVLHSLRKTAAIKVFELTKDINITRKFLNHSSILTTQIYIGLDDKDDEILSSLCLMDKIDKNLYKNADYDTLFKAVGEMDSNYQMLLNKKLMEFNSKSLI